jgi:hypothetical protein
MHDMSMDRVCFREHVYSQCTTIKEKTPILHRHGQKPSEDLFSKAKRSGDQYPMTM